MTALWKKKRAIAKRLLTEGFAVQHRDGDLFFVRHGDRAHLFERIELVFVGRENEAAVLAMAIAAVHSIDTQFAGLLERGGLDSLYTDRENGRVELSADEVSPWIERLGELAPSSVRAFAYERGDELLQRTQRARAAAHQAFGRFVEPVLPRGVDTVVQSLTHKQRDVVANMSSRPLVIGSEDLRSEYEAAVAALTAAEEPAILQLGQAAVRPAWGYEFIRQTKEVPHEVMWKIRILVDLILRRRSAAALN